MITLQIHIANQEPIRVDVEELPSLSDVAVIGNNPRDRKEKEVEWLDEGVNTVIVPWWRINYIQVLPDTDAEEDFPMLFRND